MKIFVLAGGSGTRLWPMSRKNYPKQFLKINSDKSFLQQTVTRLSGLVSLKDIIFITNDKYQSHIKSGVSASHIILEPVSKNTAPAIALGVKYCLEKLGCGLDEVICVLPSDHIIKPGDMFRRYLKYAEEIAKKGYMVTFGVRPLRAETGYGYIKVASRQSLVARGEVESGEWRVESSVIPAPAFAGVNSSGNPVGAIHESPKTSDERRATSDYNYLTVEKFVEKPDKETAQKYIDSGCYYWNSGIFAFTIGTIIEELKKHAPQIEKLMENNFEDVLNKFDKMPSLSIDYAVMEKSKRVVTVPMDLYWSDIGSWDAFFDLLEKDESGNAKIGNIVSADTKNSLIIGDKRLIVTIGLDDCIVVDTADAVLITKKGHSKNLKDIVERLEKDNRKEAI